MNTTSTPLAPLERFAARSLDFPAVVAVLERFATTSLGLRALRTLEPLGDAEALEAAQRFRELTDLLRGGAPSFGGVADPRPALEHARAAGRPFSDEEIALLRDLLEAFERLKEWFESLRAHSPALAALAVGMPDLKPLRERVETIVDERGRVRDDASPLLARLRAESRELQSKIDRELRTIIAKPEVKAVLSDLTPARRGGRSVLAVKAKSQGRVAGLVHDRSQTGESVFVEPREIVAFGNRAAEIEADERREVERVLLELTRAVLAHEEAIEESAERIAKLEIASIGARYAKECGAQLAPSVPSAKGGRELVLRAARHPLLVEQKRLGRLGEVVPVDLRLGGDFDLLLITGPNTGGKTLALKSAGLAALLARCGLPFPCADGSSVPLYDGVVADIGDEQEISQSLSTFSSHLARIKAGLARATDRTLFLLDELGGGTDPDEGAALSEALLETLLEKRSPVLASTHIGKLKEFAFRNARAENASVEFDATTLRPRYRLLIGTPGESSALSIARRLGLPHKLVDRAQQRLKRRDAETVALMADVRKARTQAEEVRKAAETRLSDVERTSREIAAKEVQISRKGELLEAEAQRSIEDRVRAARAVLASGGPLLEQVPAASRAGLAEIFRRADAELSGAAFSERREAFLDALQKGSFVYLPRLRQRVPVQRVDRAKRELKVLLGGMSMTVSFDEVTSFEAR